MTAATSGATGATAEATGRNNDANENRGSVAALTLAAGKSSRMKSKTPKTLHLVCGRPLLFHIMDALRASGVERNVVVVGHQADTVQTALDAEFGAGETEYALQAEQKGTGHAVQMAQSLLENFAGTVLVVPGDAPLLSSDILQALIADHQVAKRGATLLTAVLDTDAGSYGRVVRGVDNGVAAIVEARDATPEQLAIREINTSVYAFDGPALFRALADLRPDNAQGELYLTDVIKLMRDANLAVGALVSPDADVVLGVNTRVDLADLNQRMQKRLLRDLMLSGVTIVDPASTFVEAGVRVGQDTVLLPGTHLAGQTVIGEDCIIGPNTHIVNSTLGDRVQIRASVATNAQVGDGCKVGPFAHLRPGARLHARVKIGNFVEVKNATLHEGVAAGHLTYLGDATVGAWSNIGAGTITCNYDGYEKHQTTIGAATFIGSNTILIAPVTVGDGAATGAGSVISKSVPADALAIARAHQIGRDGWAARRRAARQAKDKGQNGVIFSGGAPQIVQPNQGDIET